MEAPLKQTIFVSDEGDLDALIKHLRTFPLPFNAALLQGKKRSLSQNAMLHVWFGEVALQIPGDTLLDVKKRSHHKYGLPILLQYEQFAWVWERTGAKMTYEQQCDYLGSGVLNISSGMTKAQLSQYMDEMQRDYQAQGIVLTHPEDAA